MNTSAMTSALRQELLILMFFFSSNSV